MTCPAICGIGAQAKGTLDAGCVPRISRVHIVVFPALRGSQACLRPTDEEVEFRPQVEHQRVSSDSHTVWSGACRMSLKWSRAARAAHLATAEPGQERPAMTFHDEDEHRHTEHRQVSEPLTRECPPS